MELISRDEAIKTARLMIGLTADERENEIRAIPTIEERKEGKWIQQPSYKPFTDDEKEIMVAPKCSVCGGHGRFRNNYCPNCGARMKG